MELGIYTIYDTVACDAGPLFTAVNTGVATRQYRALLKEVPAELRNEYKLFLIGTYTTTEPMVKTAEPLEITTNIEFEEVAQ